MADGCTRAERKARQRFGISEHRNSPVHVSFRQFFLSRLGLFNVNIFVGEFAGSFGRTPPKSGRNGDCRLVRSNLRVGFAIRSQRFISNGGGHVGVCGFCGH